MTLLLTLRAQLKKSIDTPIEKQAIFFKMGSGEYAAHDQFMGIRIPTLRRIAKDFLDLPFESIQILMESPINEERFLALIILVNRYQKSDERTKNKVYQFYLKNVKHVNNWNLVDASAHLIMGAQLFDAKDKSILIDFSTSKNMWQRRISIVSTWYFIRQNKSEWTLKIAKILLNDQQDLIHKAVGWMLRELGKKDLPPLKKYLDQHAVTMPRTMLRYAIEKFSQAERKHYLNLHKHK